MDLTPILFPKARKDNIYDMLKKLSSINERENAIEQGGDASADFYQREASKWDKIANDPSYSSAERLDAEKTARGFQLKGIKEAMATIKKIDSKGMDWVLTQDLREIEFSSPEDPWAFSKAAEIQIKRLLEGEGDENGLNQNIEDIRKYEGDEAVVTLELYRDKLENEELDKYVRIQRAFEEGDYDLLNRYGVVYDPFAKGKTKNVRIVELSELGSKARQMKTNLKFSLDENGELITSTEQGMAICFDGDYESGRKFYFNGVEFDFLQNMGFTATNPENFNHQTIKHSTVGDIEPGMFPLDSRNQLYFVNKDRTMSPIKREEWKEELGFSEDKVYKLSPKEELNTRAGVVSELPFPISERYNKQSEMSDFDSFGEFTEQMYKEFKKPSFLYKYPYELPRIGERIGEEIKKGAKSFWDITKEGLRRGVEKMKEPKELKETPSWGLEEVGKLPTLKGAKEYIKKLEEKPIWKL